MLFGDSKSLKSQHPFVFLSWLITNIQPCFADYKYQTKLAAPSPVNLCLCTFCDRLIHEGILGLYQYKLIIICGLKNFQLACLFSYRHWFKALKISSAKITQYSLFLVTKVEQAILYKKAKCTFFVLFPEGAFAEGVRSFGFSVFFASFCSVSDECQSSLACPVGWTSIVTSVFVVTSGRIPSLASCSNISPFVLWWGDFKSVSSLATCVKLSSKPKGNSCSLAVAIPVELAQLSTSMHQHQIKLRTCNGDVAVALIKYLSRALR